MVHVLIGVSSLAKVNTFPSFKELGIGMQNQRLQASFTIFIVLRDPWDTMECDKMDRYIVDSQKKTKHALLVQSWRLLVLTDGSGRPYAVLADEILF